MIFNLIYAGLCAEHYTSSMPRTTPQNRQLSLPHKGVLWVRGLAQGHTAISGLVRVQTPMAGSRVLGASSVSPWCQFPSLTLMPVLTWPLSSPIKAPHHSPRPHHQARSQHSEPPMILQTPVSIHPLVPLGPLFPQPGTPFQTEEVLQWIERGVLTVWPMSESHLCPWVQHV